MVSTRLFCFNVTAILRQGGINFLPYAFLLSYLAFLGLIWLFLGLSEIKRLFLYFMHIAWQPWFSNYHTTIFVDHALIWEHFLGPLFWGWGKVKNIFGVYACRLVIFVCHILLYSCFFYFALYWGHFEPSWTVIGSF